MTRKKNYLALSLLIRALLAVECAVLELLSALQVM